MVFLGVKLLIGLFIAHSSSANEAPTSCTGDVMNRFTMVNEDVNPDITDNIKLIKDFVGSVHDCAELCSSLGHSCDIIIHRGDSEGSQQICELSVFAGGGHRTTATSTTLDPNAPYVPPQPYTIPGVPGFFEFKPPKFRSILVKKRWCRNGVSHHIHDDPDVDFYPAISSTDFSGGTEIYRVAAKNLIAKNEIFKTKTEISTQLCLSRCAFEKECQYAVMRRKGVCFLYSGVVSASVHEDNKHIYTVYEKKVDQSSSTSHVATASSTPSIQMTTSSLTAVTAQKDEAHNNVILEKQLSAKDDDVLVDPNQTSSSNDNTKSISDRQTAIMASVIGVVCLLTLIVGVIKAKSRRAGRVPASLERGLMVGGSKFQHRFETKEVELESEDGDIEHYQMTYV